MKKDIALNTIAIRVKKLVGIFQVLNEVQVDAFLCIVLWRKGAIWVECLGIGYIAIQIREYRKKV